ncbi:MAG: demethylmenaquinone methyltransferase [Bacillota bacterium]
MTAAYFELISSDLQKVDAKINQALRIRPGYISQFAHLDLNPLQKIFHPALVLLTGRLFNQVGEKMVSLAAVVQFIYMAAMVHFGVDEDSDETGDIRDGAQFPVLVGDYLYGRFFTTLCAGGIVEYLQPLAVIIGEMNLGAVLRVKESLPQRENDPGVIEKETAALTSGCCRLAARLAGAGADAERELSDFGYNLGMGYGLLERNLPRDLADGYFDHAMARLDSMPAGDSRQSLATLVKQLKEGGISVPVRKVGAAASKKEYNKGQVEIPKNYPDKEEYVKDIFDNIAKKYDVLNTVLSFNRDKYWRKVTVEKTGLKPGGHALDVCCGTGMITVELAKNAGPGGKVTGLDFSVEMLAIARENLKGSLYVDNIEYIQGNAMDLPFADDTFDCATIGFGLRNVPDMRKTLQEMMRVLKPGGRLVCLEFAKPTVPGFKQVYNFYFDKWVPFLGKLGVGLDGPYRYLHESWKVFPHQKELKEIFTEVGLDNAHYFELTGGVVAIHIGSKPAEVPTHRSVAATKEH